MKTTERISDTYIFTIAFLIVLVSRMPFAFAGPGTDPDAWKIVMAARGIADGTGYTVSRFPGYPVVEYLASTFAFGPIWSFSLMTAISASISAGLLAIILRDFVRHAATMSALIFSVPAFFVESISGMDYMVAITFSLGAALSLKYGFFAIAAALAGLSIGARLTSICMLPILVIYCSALFEWTPRFRVRISVFLILSITVGILTYLPVYINYGISFLTFYDRSWPPLSVIYYDISRSVGGTISFLFFAACFILANIHLATKWQDIERSRQLFAISSLCGLIGYFLIFIRLPIEIGYLLLPILFGSIFIILLVKQYLSFFVLLFAASQSVVDIGVNGIGPGPAFIAHDEALNLRERAMDIARRAQKLNRRDVLVAGFLHPTIIAAPKAQYRNDQIRYSISLKEGNEIKNNGGEIYFVEELSEFLKKSSSVFHSGLHARPLPKY